MQRARQRRSGNARIALAVPSFGPLSMQPLQSHDYALMTAILQYPRSGRYRCNRMSAIGSLPSASSCSTLVRAVIDATVSQLQAPASLYVLQYPRSGRYRCNQIVYRRFSFLYSLAVPSFGPLSMQRIQICKILTASYDLQYPRSGRYRCNRAGMDRVEYLPLYLQYPRSGRYRCNVGIAQGICRSRSSCSTLVRAVIDATKLQNLSRPSDT